jgi:hypothetical protein
MENRKILTVHGNENVVCELYDDTTSVAFLADLPRDAVVDSVIVNGEHLADRELTESTKDVRVDFPRGLYLGDKRVAAVLRSSGGSDLEVLAKQYLIESFDVEYHEIAVTRL